MLSTARRHPGPAGRGPLALSRALASLTDGDQGAVASPADRAGSGPEPVGPGQAERLQAAVGRPGAGGGDDEANPGRRTAAGRALGLDAEAASAQLPGKVGDA